MTFIKAIPQNQCRLPSIPYARCKTLQNHRPAYRPDIDGLRAVAVSLVLSEHLHLPVPGGYVGVDVFFVISGYLLSGVILTDLKNGHFSIAAFYERRIRRILPAFIVMLVGASAMAIMLLTPPELNSFALSMLAALFSVSNFFFWYRAGYFDLQNASEPLLHTWSLMVEEQFYLLFPLLLMGMLRWLPSRMRAAIWTIIGLSFFLSVVWVRRNPTGAYFFAPVRAWELLCGTLLSQSFVRVPQSVTGRNIASAVGLALILVAALSFTSQTPFPGLAALPPCLGAALLIAAGETGSSLVGRLLSLRPAVFIGIISYSLYLWHWPLIVFQRSANLLHVKPGSHGVAALLLVLSIALAVLSWKFVEQPFRAGRLRLQRAMLFRTACISVTLLAALCAGTIASGGLAFRYPAPARAVAEYLRYDEKDPYREGTCFLVEPASTFASFKQSVCLPGNAEAGNRRSMLLLGDSHAAALYAGIKAMYPERELGQATAAGCRPLLPAREENLDKTCATLLRLLFEYYLPRHPGELVLLAGRWQPDDKYRLLETTEWLRSQGLRPVVFGPAVEYDEPLPRILANALRDGRPEVLAQHAAASTRLLDQEMAAQLRRDGTVYVSMYEDLCTTTTCPGYASPGVPLLFDMDHLTETGSILFARTMRDHDQLP